MTVAIPEEKLQYLNLMVQDWMLWAQGDIKQLRSLQGKLLYATYCCPPAWFFLNRMLGTLRACPPPLPPPSWDSPHTPVSQVPSLV